MNPEPTDRRDADALDAFWDRLVLGDAQPAAASPNEELVLTMQQLVSFDDNSAETRLRRLVFGSTPEPALAVGPKQPVPLPRPKHNQPGRTIRTYAQWAAAALIVLLVGSLIAAQNAGWLNGGGKTDHPTVIPAAVAQIDATPAVLASPTANTSAIVWTLPFDGTNVTLGATAIADGTLYRLVHSDQFTGVQAVDTATGTEKWRSAQEWSGNGLGADANGVYFPTPGGVRAIASASGEQLWNISTKIEPQSLAVGNGHVYLWDGRSTLGAYALSDGSIAWQGVADVATETTATHALQPPVVSDRGIVAVSGTSTIALFDLDGTFTGSGGLFDPETVELAAVADGTVVIAGAPRLETERPWARTLLLVDLADGSTIWHTDYNTTVTGLTVTDSIAFVLADNPGMAYSAENDGFDYPEQTSPQIYAYDLETGEMHVERNEAGTTAWITDSGASPYVGLANGPLGPVAISQSGQLNFFTSENPSVQAAVDLPGALPSQIVTDETAVYASVDNGTLIALAPELANIEPQPANLGGGNLDWSMPPAGTLADFGGMAYAGGVVFRLIDTGAGRQIETTYAATGQPAWTLPFDWSTNQIVADPGPDPHDPAQTWTGSGNIFAVDSENRLIAIDGTSGTLSWQHAFANPVVSFVYDADTLYVWDESGTMTALLPKDGTVLWATTPSDASGPQNNELGMPVPATTRTAIAMVDASGTLNAFSKETGEVLWSTPGFDGTNTRITHQGDAEWNQTEVFVVVSATGPAHDDGTFEQSVSGVLSATGERIWDNAMQGPLVQPVNTDEDKVVVSANQLLTGKNVPADSTPIADGESFNHYNWTSTGEAVPEGGGQRLFALQADTGEIVWIRTTAAGGFTDLATKFPTGGGTLYVATSDGLVVSPNRGNGAIDGEPTALGGPVLTITPSGEAGAIGSFATLADGTLVSFGGTPFSQQG